LLNRFFTSFLSDSLRPLPYPTFYILFKLWLAGSCRERLLPPPPANRSSALPSTLNLAAQLVLSLFGFFLFPRTPTSFFFPHASLLSEGSPSGQSGLHTELLPLLFSPPLLVPPHTTFRVPPFQNRLLPMKGWLFPPSPPLIPSSFFPSYSGRFFFLCGICYL